MSRKLNRREFVMAGAAAGLAAASPGNLGAQAQSRPQSPTVMTRKSVKPVVISSANGNRFKNGGDMTCVEKAFSMIVKGSDVLDALIAGVNIVELDPLDDSVGYGGLPNAEGVVQLDSSCMHGPKKRAGGVAAIEGDLNTPNSRAKWLEWKRRTDPLHYLDPQKREEAERRVISEMVAEGLINENHIYGTINCDGINARGEICGVTTTSGLAWKIPGRVGDSPILGAGLYVDGEVGAAGSTGRGEANLYNLCSFLIVENMRRGMHPKDAGMDALKRIKANTVEKRLLNPKGEPNFGINFYVLNAQGEYAGVGMYGGERAKYAVCTENGAQLLPIEPLLQGTPAE